MGRDVILTWERIKRKKPRKTPIPQHFCKNCRREKAATLFRADCRWGTLANVCRACEARLKRLKTEHDTLREPKKWDVVREAYALTEVEEKLVERAAKAYLRNARAGGVRLPCKDGKSPLGIIEAVVQDTGRQNDLLACVAYRAAYLGALARKQKHGHD